MIRTRTTALIAACLLVMTAQATYSNSKGLIPEAKPQNPFLAGNMIFNARSSANNIFLQFGTQNASNIVMNPPPSVPEGGATIALLGTILSGFVLIRRKLN